MDGQTRGVRLAGLDAWLRHRPWVPDVLLALAVALVLAPTSLTLVWTAGWSAADQAVKVAPDGPRVVVLTTFDLDEHAFAAMKAGASGFLLKDAAAEDVLSAIRAVHAGDAVLAPSTTRRLIEHVAGDLPGPRSGPDPLARLTEREREVLLQVSTGASNAEIAERLFLSEATVKTHVGRLLTKLGLRDRVQAVVLAYETGLVRPGS